MAIERDETPTYVTFRKWENGAITALFPELPADMYGRYCDSYDLFSGHGEADYDLVVANTLVAEPAEYKHIKRVLEQHYGYNLVVVTGATDQMHRNRRRTAVQWAREWKQAA